MGAPHSSSQSNNERRQEQRETEAARSRNATPAHNQTHETAERERRASRQRTSRAKGNQCRCVSYRMLPSLISYRPASTALEGNGISLSLCPLGCVDVTVLFLFVCASRTYHIYCPSFLYLCLVVSLQLPFSLFPIRPLQHIAQPSHGTLSKNTHPPKQKRKAVAVIHGLGPHT